LSLSDAEDGPPFSSSIPPEPVEPFREAPDTIPAPSLADECAAACAKAVIDALSPKIEAVDSRLDRLERIIRSLDAEVVELRTWRTHADKMMDAIDRGVAAALSQVGDLNAAYETTHRLQRDTANGVMAVAADLQDLRASVLRQAEHDGAKRRDLEQSVSDLQDEAEQRRSVAGE
jgi:chromosome segregation ATPase